MIHHFFSVLNFHQLSSIDLCSRTIRYAIVTGRGYRNPTPDLKGALPSPRVKHLAAVIEPEKVGELLRVIDSYIGSFTVRSALRLAPLVFVRPGELR